MHVNFVSIARAAMTALLVSASAQATIINEFTNVGAWTAATTSQVTQTFGGSDIYNYTSAGISIDGINYLGFYSQGSGTGYSTFRMSPPAEQSIGSGGTLTGGNWLWDVTSGYVNGLVIALNAPSVTPQAIGFNFSAFRQRTSNDAYVYSTASTPIVLNFELYESNILTETRSLTVPFSAGSPVAGYFGFTTSGTVTSIRLLIDSPSTTYIDRVILDNFAYAQIAASGGEEPPSGGGGGEIPEPATYFITAAGLFLLARFRKH